MYSTHFGLRQRPFGTTADSGCYYPATGHEAALAALCQALAEDEGLALVTGAAGIGKTLIALRLLDRVEPVTNRALLTNSHFGDRAGLFQAILFDLTLPYEGRREQELRLALTEWLLGQYAAGKRTVLVIDEAQHLSADLLEEVRLLGNLEARRGKALQVILLAQPTIHAALARPELAGFRQRLAVQVVLEPLGVHESADYVVHQLRAVGGRPEELISDEALDVVARGALGIPRLLNRAAHQSFCLAARAGADVVDAEAALEALAILGLDAEPEARDEDETAREAPSAPLITENRLRHLVPSSRPKD